MSPTVSSAARARNAVWSTSLYPRRLIANQCVRLNMAINTRLTEKFKLTRPVVLAPMGVATSGRLAAAVADAGGLGLIGVGYQG